MFGKKTTYTASVLKSGETAVLRSHAFTRWLTRDLLQASTDFCRNLGLHAIYTEMNEEGLFRKILWSPPVGTRFEVRSGRTRAEFEEYDRVNAERNWTLLTLHVWNRHYSAVWVSAEQYAGAVTVLQYYGISPAQKQLPQ